MMKYKCCFSDEAGRGDGYSDENGPVLAFPYEMGRGNGYGKVSGGGWGLPISAAFNHGGGYQFVYSWDET
jgi:hypothetical protein